MEFCVEIVNHIEIDINKFIYHFKNEIPAVSGIDRINEYDDSKFDNTAKKVVTLLKDIKEELQAALQEGLQHEEENRIHLQECLRNIGKVEENLINLFRTMILKLLEYKRKNSLIGFVTKSNNVPNPFDNGSKIKANQKDICSESRKFKTCRSG